MRFARLAGILLPALVASTLAIGTAEAAAPGVPAARPSQDPFVGNQMCVRCHEPLQQALVARPHGGRAAVLADRGCQSCHGPGRVHVQRPDDPSRQPDIERLPLADQNQLCLECHTNVRPYDERAHALDAVTCSGCHSFHEKDENEGVLAWQSNCLSCHRGESAFDTLHDYDMAAMEAGTVSCTSCHHGAHGRAD